MRTRTTWPLRIEHDAEKCTKCSSLKPISEFPLRTKKSKLHRTVCRTCTSIMCKAWQDKNVKPFHPNWYGSFWAKVEKTPTCWLWKGSVSQGYGATYFRGHLTRAHRASWIMANGEIPKGKIACHKCDVPLCVNPDHIFIGTHKDNMQDMISKGRGAWQKKILDGCGVTAKGVLVGTHEPVEGLCRFESGQPSRQFGDRLVP